MHSPHLQPPVRILLTLGPDTSISNLSQVTRADDLEGRRYPWCLWQRVHQVVVGGVQRLNRIRAATLTKESHIVLTPMAERFEWDLIGTAS